MKYNNLGNRFALTALLSGLHSNYFLRHLLLLIETQNEYAKNT